MLVTFNPQSNYESIEIELPSSKSISNRVLVIDFIRDGSVGCRHGISQSDDTKTLMQILTHLANRDETNFQIGNNGAICRFLIPLLATTCGIFTLDGDDRMRKRPICELVEAMNSLGARITYVNNDGCLPIRIEGNDNIQRDHVAINCERSSQFISALILVAPRLRNGLKIKIVGKTASPSYFIMTCKLMREFGVKVSFNFDEVSISAGQNYIKNSNHVIEKDWSSASYWYLALSMLPADASILLKGLSFNSIQGDKAIMDIANSWGITSRDIVGGVIITNRGKIDDYTPEYECENFPDLVPTIVVACSVLNIKVTLKNIDVLKHKESNRLEALICEMSKIGSRIEYFDGKITIKPNFETVDNHFRSYADHRLVMSFMPLAIRFGELFVENTSVIDKSYPHFFDELKKIGIFTHGLQHHK